jgi:hypothetical protein
MRFVHRQLSGLAAASAIVPAALALSTAPARAVEIGVQWSAGTYLIAQTCPNSVIPCGAQEDASLKVTISGPTVSFTVTDLDNSSEDATFTLPNYEIPAGVITGDSPYFSVLPDSKGVVTLQNANWDTTAYPYVTFYSAANGGGLTIGSAEDGTPPNLTVLFNSAQTTGSPYALVTVPEPEAWSLMLVGVGFSGAVLRRRKAPAAV